MSVSQEKSSKHLPLKVYLVLIGGVGLAIALLLIGRYSSPPARSPDLSSTVDPSKLSPEIPVAPTVAPSASTRSPAASVASSPEPSAAIATTSNLRVSNRTIHPMRVALLAQPPDAVEPTSLAQVEQYQEPAHWDFAPGEGSQQGLLLSLPDQDLQLHPGDVLVAFAQDGSRLYWGPYVVGVTPLPRWNEQTEEWQLILEP